LGRLSSLDIHGRWDIKAIWNPWMVRHVGAGLVWRSTGMGLRFFGFIYNSTPTPNNDTVYGLLLTAPQRRRCNCIYPWRRVSIR
jgi:hypothetical protein